jgi:hypothetical protein
MLEEMMRQVERLSKTKIEIVAVGNYPTKARTKVQSVAIYQNDGTERIEPAKFIEAAEKENQGWQREIDHAASEFLDGNENEVVRLGNKVADDINKAVNRIDTGRLRESMRSVVKK